jgi:hypothetical protein
MATTYTTSQSISIPANCVYIIANVVSSGGQTITAVGGHGARVNTIIPRSSINSYSDLYLSISSSLSQASFLAIGTTNTFTNLIAVSGAGGQAGGPRNGYAGGLGGNGGYFRPQGNLISGISGFTVGSSGYVSGGQHGGYGDGWAPEDPTPFNGSATSGGVGQGGGYNGGGGGGGGYGGGGAGGGNAGSGGSNGANGNNGSNNGYGNGGTGGLGVASGGTGGSGGVKSGGGTGGRGGNGFSGGGGGGSGHINSGGGGGGGSSFSFFEATFESANNRNTATGAITIQFVLQTDFEVNINNTSDWQSYISSSTNNNYYLYSDLIFNNSFAGNLYLRAGKLFDGRNNTIFLNNLSTFSGLFNLHSGNVDTFISNLRVVASNVSLTDNNGFYSQGSSNGSITANGNIYSCKVIFKNSVMGNNCGGFIGASSKNIIIGNSYVNGTIYGINSGGLIGNNSSNAIIRRSYVIGNIQSSSGGLVGNNSTITYITDSYCAGFNTSITLSGTTITSQDNVYTANLKKLL